MNKSLDDSFNFSFILFLSLGIPGLIFIKDPGFDPLSFSEIAIFMLILSYYLITLSKKIGPILLTFLVIYIFLIIYLILQLLINLRSSSIVSFLTHFKYILIVFTIIKIVSVRNETRLLLLLVAVGFISQLSALYILIQDLGALSSLYGVGGFLRITSLFPNPNMFGMYLTVISLLCLYLSSVVKIQWRKYLLFILASSSILILLTFSRRSWLLYILAFFIYIIFSKINKRKTKILSFFIIAGLVSVYVDLQSIIIRFFSIFDSNYESNSARSSHFLELYNLIDNTANFIFGYGPGLIGPTSIFSSSPMHLQIDNYILLLWLEYGLVGLFIYFCFYFITLYYGFKSIKYLKGNDYNRILIYIIIITILFLAGFVGSTPITFPLNLLYWIFTGLILKNYRKLYYSNE